MNKKTLKQGYKSALDMFFYYPIDPCAFTVTCDIEGKEDKEMDISMLSLRWRKYSNRYIKQKLMRKMNTPFFLLLCTHINIVIFKLRLVFEILQIKTMRSVPSRIQHWLAYTFIWSIVCSNWKLSTILCIFRTFYLIHPT